MLSPTLTIVSVARGRLRPARCYADLETQNPERGENLADLGGLFASFEFGQEARAEPADRRNLLKVETAVPTMRPHQTSQFPGTFHGSVWRIPLAHLCPILIVRYKILCLDPVFDRCRTERYKTGISASNQVTISAPVRSPRPPLPLPPAHITVPDLKPSGSDFALHKPTPDVAEHTGKVLAKAGCSDTDGEPLRAADAV